MQVDVCQYRANYAALGCSGQRVLSGPIEVLIPRPEKTSDDREKSLVLDLLSEDTDQYFVIDVVKRSYNLLPYSRTQMKKIQPRSRWLIPRILSLGVISH